MSVDDTCVEYVLSALSAARKASRARIPEIMGGLTSIVEHYADRPIYQQATDALSSVTQTYGLTELVSKTGK